MHKFRTHNCNELNQEHTGQKVKLSGWLHRRRNHGSLLFIDLRDHYGITQLVFTNRNLSLQKEASYLRCESVITIEGQVICRDKNSINHSIDTGNIEVNVNKCITESEVNELPIIVNTDEDDSEEKRLKYRFLDLRRRRLHNNIMLRSEIILELRKQMVDQGFTEIQTPILTASSPEGARDFLVPSRCHPGKFYALPQAPQQFKQLLMVSGFDKYFQIAPCFRDEDARSDRSPGEFYQLDMEMSFATQEDIFAVVEPLLYKIFTKFSNKKVSKAPFARVTYADAMLRYGTDKPDTRNPLKISDVTEIFFNSKFDLFKKQIETGAIVRAIPAPKTSNKSRKFFNSIVEFAMREGADGLGYIQFIEDKSAKGPIAKFLSTSQLRHLRQRSQIGVNDSIFFVCAPEMEAAKISGKVRNKLGEELDIISSNCFEFCWITDFPFYEFNQDKQKIDFSHNPFSMPQGGLQTLENAISREELLNIKALQYDIVCNGVELSSGAIRNHKPDLMYKAFEIAGYTRDEVNKKFGAMIKAFRCGAPPHGGIAPGIDRMVMLIANATNIREVIAFPMNQNAEDLMIGSPSQVSELQLDELNITTKRNK